MEAGKKLPRRFPTLAESIGANHLLVVASFDNLKTDLKSGPFNDKYICHSLRFNVCEWITFSFFDKLKFLSAKSLLHLNIISANKFPPSFCF